MSWDQKYWDIVNHLYWWPPYVGMRSIPQRLWETSEDRVSVPRELVNTHGPLYSRAKRYGDLEADLRGREEILNHVFNIALSIAPDALIRELLLRPAGLQDAGSFDSIGREMDRRYGWSDSENVTQHDGLFVSASTALCVELKLKATTSIGQLAKYVAILTWEQIHVAPRQQVGLLFVLSREADSKHWKQCGLAGPHIDRSHFELLRACKLPSRVSRLFEERRPEVESVLDRMTVAATTWTEMRSACINFQSRLDTRSPGDQTLHRLLQGFVNQLGTHRDTGIS